MVIVGIYRFPSVKAGQDFTQGRNQFLGFLYLIALVRPPLDRRNNGIGVYLEFVIFPAPRTPR